MRPSFYFVNVKSPAINSIVNLMLGLMKSMITCGYNPNPTAATVKIPKTAYSFHVKSANTVTFEGPNIDPWYARSMYTAPKTKVVAAVNPITQ
jgi:hypothetical protein